MPRQRFATKAEVEELLRLEYNVTDIAAKYNVTPQTVYNAIHAYRLDGHIEERIPSEIEFGWVVKPEHHQDYHLRMLRLVERKRRGKKIISADWERQADRWLEERQKEGVVVTYHPGRGFGLSPRRAGDEWAWRPGYYAHPVRKPPRKPASKRKANRIEEN